MNDPVFAIDSPESAMETIKFHVGKAIRLRADQIGAGPTYHVHPENYKKLIHAEKSHKGLTLSLAHGEIASTFASALTGSGFWGSVRHGIKKTAGFLKNSGILSKLLDTGIPAAATALGVPEATPIVRGGVKQLTGVGMEGGRLTLSDVKHHVGKAFGYAKRKRIVSDVIDQGEKFLLSEE
ncbi:hypothetical protein ON010_g1936 [Phytophthora cinnamomi]|nr:hypothetical protein ON010_g1936 [Phytophthora cinnamomi]